MGLVELQPNQVVRPTDHVESTGAPALAQVNTAPPLNGTAIR